MTPGHNLNLSLTADKFPDGLTEDKGAPGLGRN